MNLRSSGQGFFYFYQMIRPIYLKEGDSIAIVGLANKIKKADIQHAVSVFENWGLQVILANHLFDTYHQFAGKEVDRLTDLQQALDNENIKAIISARGGYGSNQLINNIDWSGFLQSPKWIIGFSDITILLGEIYNRNVQSVHGHMPALFRWKGSEKSVDALKKLLFGDPEIINSPHNVLNKAGNTQGILIGGNLSILTSMISTPSDFNYEDKILMIEEISEPQYKIDRMMSQLSRAGKLKNLKGVVCGKFTDCQGDDDYGKSALEIVKEHVTHYNYPCSFDVPIGHEALNYPVIIGGKYSLKVDERGASLSFIK